MRKKSFSRCCFFYRPLISFPTHCIWKWSISALYTIVILTMNCIFILICKNRVSHGLFLTWRKKHVNLRTWNIYEANCARTLCALCLQWIQMEILISNSRLKHDYYIIHGRLKDISSTFIFIAATIYTLIFIVLELRWIFVSVANLRNETIVHV